MTTAIPGLEAPAHANPVDRVTTRPVVTTEPSEPKEPGLPAHEFLFELAKRLEDSDPDLATRISCVASHLTLFKQAHESVRDQLQRKTAEVDRLRKELEALRP